MDREGREQFLRKLTRPSDLRRVLFLFLTVVCLFHRFFLFFTFVSFLSSAFMEIGELNWNRLTHPSRKERGRGGGEGWLGSKGGRAEGEGRQVLSGGWRGEGGPLMGVAHSLLLLLFCPELPAYNSPSVGCG